MASMVFGRRGEGGVPWLLTTNTWSGGKIRRGVIELHLEHLGLFDQPFCFFPTFLTDWLTDPSSSSQPPFLYYIPHPPELLCSA